MLAVSSCVLVILQTQIQCGLTEEECSGSVKLKTTNDCMMVYLSVTIPDFNNTKHEYFGNNTVLNIDARKGELLTVAGSVVSLNNILTLFIHLMCILGDCCFTIFENYFGDGQGQDLDSAGGFRLSLEKVSSLFIVECISIRYLSSYSLYC